MANARIFVIGFVAALLWGPRSGGVGESGSAEAGIPPASTPVQVAARVDGERGVWNSFEEAVVWFRARAAKGDSAAQYELAHLQFTGVLPRRGADETLRLLTAAAEGGHDQAQLLLARLYEFGFEGTRPDLVQALKWNLRAAACASAADLRAAAAEAGARLRSRLSSGSIAEAETLAALDWSGAR